MLRHLSKEIVQRNASHVRDVVRQELHDERLGLPEDAGHALHREVLGPLDVDEHQVEGVVVQVGVQRVGLNLDDLGVVVGVDVAVVHRHALAAARVDGVHLEADHLFFGAGRHVMRLDVGRVVELDVGFQQAVIARVGLDRHHLAAHLRDGNDKRADVAADHEHRRRLVNEGRDTLHFVHAVGAVEAQFRTHFQIGRIHGEAAVLRVHDEAGHVVAKAALKPLGLPVLQKEIRAPVQ